MARTERSGQPRQAGQREQASQPARAQGGSRVRALVWALLLALVRVRALVWALLLAVAGLGIKLVALLLLAVAGVGIAVYLTLEHFQKAPLFCSATGTVDCAPVLSSAYSVVPGT